MKNFRTEGIVIKRQNSGELDRILTVFTKDLGKIKIKATGVRRIASRRSPHIELLNYSVLSLYKSNGLPILIEATTLRSHSSLKEDLKMIGIAYHLCELIDCLCPENQENKKIFVSFVNALLGLLESTDPKKIVHDFEKDIIYNLGFYPNMLFSKTSDTHAVIEQIIERKLKTTRLITYFL